LLDLSSSSRSSRSSEWVCGMGPNTPQPMLLNAPKPLD